MTVFFSSFGGGDKINKEYGERWRSKRTFRNTRQIVYTALILTILESFFVLEVDAVVSKDLVLKPSSQDGSIDDVDSDEILRSILTNYYNALEKHKQRKQNGQDVLEQKYEKEEKQKEEQEEDPLILLEDSIGDSVLDYVKDHIKTRIWSSMFPEHKSAEEREQARQRTNKNKVHDYGDTHIWWEQEEEEEIDSHLPKDTLLVKKGFKENQTRQMVNRIFTASGFALSLVVLVIFFLACTYCWCIGSPSKMLGALSTVLAIILLLHRLHEFFLVFSPEDLKNAGSALLGGGEGGEGANLYYEATLQ
ncbi:MAG: hypothetical protein ACTSUE_15915 [Promethearchaeota archaeon]